MVDLIDRKILTALMADSKGKGRQKEIAEELGIGAPAVSKKINKLVDEKIIEKYCIDIDYAKLGYTTHCVTWLKIPDHYSSKTPEIIEKLLAIDEAVEVYKTFNNWDLYIRWLCATNANVQQLLDQALGSGFTTHTHVLTEQLRRERGPNPSKTA